jgi:stress response protein YsnF
VSLQSKRIVMSIDEEKRRPKGEEVAVLPIVDESLHVGKRQVVTGRVRVRTVTDLSEERIRQELSGQHVEVERVPVDVLVERDATPPEPRTEGDVTIVPILEEVLVVEKRLLIKEELRITRHRTTNVTDVAVPLRKQRAEIERLKGDSK